MKNKITVIRSNALGTPRAAKYCRMLYDLGYQVSLLRWNRFDSSDGVRYQEYLRNIRIVNISSYSNTNNCFISRTIARTQYIFGILRYAVKNGGVYVCIDFDSAFPAYLARIVNRDIKYIYDIADFIHEYSYHFPRLLHFAINKLDQKIQAKSEYIFLPDMNRVNKLNTSLMQKVEIINNAPLYDIKTSKLGQCKTYINPNKINIFYYGVLSNDRGLQFIIDLAEKYVSKVCFYVAGKGRCVNAIQQNKYLCFLGELEYKDCMANLYKMDLSYIVYDPSVVNNQAASPNKLFEAIQLGIPMVVAKGTSIDSDIESNKIGYSIEYNKNSLQQLLDELSKHSIQNMKQNYIKEVDAYSFKESKEIFEKIVLSLENIKEHHE